MLVKQWLYEPKAHLLRFKVVRLKITRTACSHNLDSLNFLMTDKSMDQWILSSEMSWLFFKTLIFTQEQDLAHGPI